MPLGAISIVFTAGHKHLIAVCGVWKSEVMDVCWFWHVLILMLKVCFSLIPA